MLEEQLLSCTCGKGGSRKPSKRQASKQEAGGDVAMADDMEIDAGGPMFVLPVRSAK